MEQAIRKALVLKLKPVAPETGIDWHDTIWPELRQEIARQGIAEISLYRLDDLVFRHSRGGDPEAWTRLRDSEGHHRWTKELMEPLMHSRDDGIVDARELREIWHIAPYTAR
jgi:L-rhamnose mutarotase